MFSQTRKIDNIGVIVNFMCPYLSIFRLYFYQRVLVNVKLDISEYI